MSRAVPPRTSKSGRGIRQGLADGWSGRWRRYLHIGTVILALALILAPLETNAGDLVVWWEEGWYPEEDAAVAELVAAFVDQTGTKIELVRIRGGDPQIR